MATAVRRITCRMEDMYGDRCTGEALDPNGDVLICIEHAAKVMRLINDRMPTKRRKAA